MGHCIKHRPTYYLVCAIICFLAAAVPAYYGMSADKSFGHYLVSNYNTSDNENSYYLSLNRIDVSITQMQKNDVTNFTQIESCSYASIKLHGYCGNVTGITNVSSIQSTIRFIEFLLIVVGVCPIVFFIAQIVISIYDKHHESETSEKLFRYARLSMILPLLASVFCFLFSQYRFNTMLSYIPDLLNKHSILFLVNISTLVCTGLGSCFIILSYLAILCCNGHHHHHHHHHHHDGYHTVQTHE